MSDDTNQDTESNKEPAPGSDEYNQMMAEKFREAKESSKPYPDDDDDANDGGTEGKSTDHQEDDPSDLKAQIPEGIPDKFIKEDGTVDVNALAKSYRELEKNTGSKANEDDSDQGKQDQQEDKNAEDAAKAAGLDPKDLEAKVVENGSLEESDYEALEKSGISREMVDDYIQLRQERAERQHQDAIEYGGGAEATKELMEWASENLSQEEIQEYNKMLDGPNWKVAMDTLMTVKSKASKTSSEPNLRRGPSSPGGSTTGYTSREEMRADMAKPEYRDPGPEGEKFRAEVQRKMKFASWRRA